MSANGDVSQRTKFLISLLQSSDDGLFPSEALLFLCSLSSVCYIILIRGFGSSLCSFLQTRTSLVAPKIQLVVATRPVALFMGPNKEVLCLRIEAERATETWCFNCSTDDGQSPKKKMIF
jgi:hypothetical protein